MIYPRPPPVKAWVSAASGDLYSSHSPLAPSDTIAPDRPSPEHTWVAGAWTVDLTAIRLLALKTIDTKAEEVRLRYITPGAGQAGTYLIKERQAEAFQDAGYLGDIPLMVDAEMDATGLTAQEACDLILAQRDIWLVKAADIERARRTGKVAVELAANATAANAARDAATAALEAL